MRNGIDELGKEKDSMWAIIFKKENLSHIEANLEALLSLFESKHWNKYSSCHE